MSRLGSGRSMRHGSWYLVGAGRACARRGNWLYQMVVPALGVGRARASRACARRGNWLYQMAWEPVHVPMPSYLGSSSLGFSVVSMVASCVGCSEGCRAGLMYRF